MKLKFCKQGFLKTFKQLAVIDANLSSTRINSTAKKANNKSKQKLKCKKTVLKPQKSHVIHWKYNIESVGILLRSIQFDYDVLR